MVPVTDQETMGYSDMTFKKGMLFSHNSFGLTQDKSLREGNILEQYKPITMAIRGIQTYLKLMESLTHLLDFFM